jgi:hypothetical protein
MRIWLAAIAILFCYGAPLEAQELARVERTFRVSIPEFMIIEAGEVQDELRRDGTYVRRVTLYVTANRSWRLQIERVCEGDCASAEYEVSRVSGSAAQQQEIVVEFSAGDESSLPRAEDYAYSLISS